MNTDCIQSLCHIFNTIGLTDLRLIMDKSRVSNPSFVRDPSYYPFPRISFYSMDWDRYEVNMGVCKSVLARDNEVCKTNVSELEAIVSVANCNRGVVERKGLDFNNVVAHYENCIILSGDQSSVRMMSMIKKRTNCVAYCSTDEGMKNAVPEGVRKIIAEAFSGLALVAVHENRVYQAISYSTAALNQHPDALQFIAAIRLAAAARQNARAVLFLTEMVLLPFFLRSSEDPVMKKLYDTEMSIWDPSVHMSTLPRQLANISQSMLDRFSGTDGVIRAKFQDSVFVEKLCSTCGKGFLGEKLRRCKCNMAYYCDKECQKAHWAEHKKTCKA